MMTLELDKQTEVRFSKLLSIHGNDSSSLINAIIDYRISELKKGIGNLELDIVGFEKKYNISSTDFYNKYMNGEYGEDSHSNDFMIWSAEFESYNEFKNELQQLL